MKDAAGRARRARQLWKRAFVPPQTLQRRLLEPGRHARVDLGGLITELATDIEGVTGLVCQVDSEPVNLPGSVATHLATCVNELVLERLQARLSWCRGRHRFASRAVATAAVGCACQSPT